MSLLERFKPALSAGRPNDAFLIGDEGGYSVYYVPFEYVNTAARLVLVGITPGPTQMKCAYAAARRHLRASVPDQEVLKRSKQSCAFIGMRDKINEMLDHFAVPALVGAQSGEALWENGFDSFHVTSIVPNAAFINGKYFNGPFAAVLKSPLLRGQFEGDFVESIKTIGPKARYVGMGPVVDEALLWCVSRGVLREEQILGYLPHASGASGSQFAYFVRKKSLSELKPTDPVRYRAKSLDAAYERMQASIKRWSAANAA